MTDVPADSLRIPLATSAMTRKAQGAGQLTFGFVGLLALTLKLYEFGAQSEWAFLTDFANPAAAHIVQWVRIGILLLEALATAAVVSIAVTYVVVNNTVNNSTMNNTTVTNYNGQDLGQVVTAIGTQLAEVRDRIAAFEQHLVRTEEGERRRMLEFLALAESDRNKRQEEQLKADKQLLSDIGETLKKIVSVIPPGP